MKRWIVLVLFACLLTGCSNNPQQQITTIQPRITDATPTLASSPTPTRTPTKIPTAKPTIPPALPTARPTPRPTKKPTPRPTPTKAPTGHICTLASCDNPWGYHLVVGDEGNLVTAPPDGFCSWWQCASDFWTSGGPGSIVACQDNTFDWDSARGADCFNDGGIRGWLVKS